MIESKDCLIVSNFDKNSDLRIYSDLFGFKLIDLTRISERKH